MNTSNNELNDREPQLNTSVFPQSTQKNENSNFYHYRAKISKMNSIELFRSRTRFYLLFLVLICLASIWSNILSFNFALMCLSPKESKNNSFELNKTNNNLASSEGLTATKRETKFSSNLTSFEESEKKQTYEPSQRLYLTSVVAAAALITNFPIVILVNRYGIRTIFVILGYLSGVSTCFFPLAINKGYYCVLFIRALQGVSFAVTFPVIGSFTSNWTYYKQNGLFVSALVAYLQLSPAVTMPLSGALCASPFKWPSVFYTHGILSIVLFTVFAALYRNNPAKHPLVNKTEVNKIAVGKTEVSKDKLKNIPYFQILKTPSVWAIWIAAIGNFFCVNMLFLYSICYLRSVLKFEVEHTGFLGSIAPLAQFSIKIISGLSSDKIKFLSEKRKLQVYNSIAFFGSAFFFFVLSCAPPENKTLCLILLGLAAGILGFTTGGFFKAGPMVSRHYSHFVTGNVSLGITITMLIVPIIVIVSAPNHTASQWSFVFRFTAGVLIVTNLLFIFMCSALPASWTTDEFSKNSSNSSNNKVYSYNPTDTASTTQPSFA